MGTILEDIHGAADWIAKALQSSGYKADFSPSSLWEIDRFFDEHSRDGTAIAGGFLSEQLGQRLFGLGSYVGEVVRRAKGGSWSAVDNEAEAEINAQLQVGDQICWPVQRVMKRFKNGPEDGIAVYGLSLGLDVGARPALRHRKPWWKVW
jgi:hypothetical protein